MHLICKNKLGSLPISSKRAYSSVIAKLVTWHISFLAAPTGGCMMRVGVDCHELTEGQQSSWMQASFQPPARTPAHLPTPGAFSLMAQTGFSLCHDAFIKLVYSLFSTAGHRSHLCSLTAISQAAQSLEDMEAVFQCGFIALLLQIPLQSPFFITEVVLLGAMKLGGCGLIRYFLQAFLLQLYKYRPRLSFTGLDNCVSLFKLIQSIITNLQAHHCIVTICLYS